MPTTITTTTIIDDDGTSNTTTSTTTNPPSPPYPHSIDALTNAYLSEKIGFEVCGFHARPVDKSGFLADTFFVRVFYREGTGEDNATPPEGAPATVVVKNIATIDQAAQTAVATGSYMKEVECYKIFSKDPDFPLKTPKAYACEGDREACFLILEDLRDTGNIIDQVGPNSSSLEVTTKAFRDLAKLNGKFADLKACTNVPILREEWLAMTGPENFMTPPIAVLPLMKQLPSGKAAWPAVQDYWLDSAYQKKIVDEAAVPNACKAFEMMCSEDFPFVQDSPLGMPMTTLTLQICKRMWSKPVRTFNHGDSRGDNSFLTNAGDICWLDWQLSHTGNFGWDPCHYVYQTLEPDCAAAAEEQLLRSVYYEAVAVEAEKRIPNFRDLYTFDDLMDDYRCCILLWSQCVTGYLAQLMEQNRKNLALRQITIAGNMISRSMAMIERVGALAVLEECAAEAKK